MEGPFLTSGDTVGIHPVDSISHGWQGLKVLPPLLKPRVLPKGLQGWLSGKKYV